MHPTHNPPSEPASTGDITPAVILRGAARYLELHGWIQGAYYDATDNPFPAACAAGAIGMAAFGDIQLPHDEHTAPGACDYHWTCDVLADYLDRTGHVEPPADDDWASPNPFDWNDRPSHTAEQVITTMRAAADDYERTPATAGGAP
jgi:hypothetical protein